MLQWVIILIKAISIINRKCLASIYGELLFNFTNIKKNVYIVSLYEILVTRAIRGPVENGIKNIFFAITL